MGDATNIVRAFSADHVIHLTGLSKGQLAYWDKTEFFQPAHGAENRRFPYSRIYSFKDVVGLRTLSILRNTYKCSLPHLREVARELVKYSEYPWADTKLYVLGRKVYFQEPETGLMRGVVNKQYTVLPLVDIAEDMREKAEKLKHRDAGQTGQIVQHRLVAHNAPVIAGTRIPIRAIQQFAEAGYTAAQIMREYPMLTEVDIEAALQFNRKLTA